MGLEDIRAAKGLIRDIKIEKLDKVGEHRKALKELEELGVNKNKPDSIQRSETYKEVLGPIEDEIKKIAEKILKLRGENDLQPSRREILIDRKNRLQNILSIISNKWDKLVEVYKSRGGVFNNSEEYKITREDHDRCVKLINETCVEIDKIDGKSQ